MKAASATPQGRRIANNTALLETIFSRANDGPKSRLLETEPALGEVYGESGKRLKALHSLPILQPDSPAIGAIALLTVRTRLESSEWALLESFADQAAQALERVRLFAREHELAVSLQRSLLPARLPSSEGVALAGHYRAGADAVEVGGDWYDAVQRPDGILQLCVGDVSGKGIGAATVMGRQRNTFHVYAHDFVSPAEIIRRMLRHVEGDEMITVACASFDPFTGELTYSCAGHPPPLLLDRVSGELIRLDRASAPPVGVAEPGDVVESTVLLSDHVVLAMYTDGLIERRGENIDTGIDVLGQVLADESELTPVHIMRTVSGLIGSPDDDVALMLMTLDGERTTFVVEVPAEPSSLAAIRRRLRAWLARRDFDEEESGQIVVAVSEACNNAIEHAYLDAEGTMRLTVEHANETFRVVVEDHGSWREERSSSERGRGIMLMKQLMHSAEIETDRHGTRVTLERRVQLHSKRPKALR